MPGNPLSNMVLSITRNSDGRIRHRYDADREYVIAILIFFSDLCQTTE